MSDRDHTERDAVAAGPAHGVEPGGDGPATMLGSLAQGVGAAALQRKIQRRAIQRKLTAGADVPAPAASAGEAAPADAGAPMPEPARAHMEQAFDADFSAVRVHVGDDAPRLGAEAYTQGNDIHFAPGRYDPASPAGLELVGHELSHVVQQRDGRVADGQGPGASIDDDPGLEAEADLHGARAASGEPVGDQAATPASDAGGDSVGSEAIQAKIARGGGWGWPTWNEGGAAAWGILESRYDAEFTPAAATLTEALRSADPLEEQEQTDVAAIEAARKWDREVIPYREGIALSKVLDGLIGKATGLSKSLPTRRLQRLAGEAQELVTRLGQLGEKVQKVTGHIEAERLEERRTLAALVRGWTGGKKPISNEELGGARTKVALLEEAFLAAETLALKAKPKVTPESEATTTPEPVDEPVVVVAESSQVALLKKTNRGLYVQLLRQSDDDIATLNRLIELAGHGGAGKVSSSLAFVSAVEWIALQQVHGSSADELNRLLIAAGAERFDDVKAMLDATPKAKGSVERLIGLLDATGGDPDNRLAAVLSRPAANMSHILELIRQVDSDELLVNLAQPAVKMAEVATLLGTGSKKDAAYLIEQLPDTAFLLLLEPIIAAPLELRLLVADLAGNGAALARVRVLLGGPQPPDKDAVYAELTVKQARGLRTAAGGDIPTRGLGDLVGTGEQAGVKATLAHIRGGDAPVLTHASGAKFGDTWDNNEGRLPGVRGAGGYLEYYVEKDPADPEFHGSRRLLVSETSGFIYYTARHYAAGSFTRLLV